MLIHEYEKKLQKKKLGRTPELQQQTTNNTWKNVINAHTYEKTPQKKSQTSLVCMKSRGKKKTTYKA